MPRRTLRLLLPLVAALVALAAGPGARARRRADPARAGRADRAREAARHHAAGGGRRARSPGRRGRRRAAGSRPTCRRRPSCAASRQVGSVVVIDLDQTFAEAEEAADLRARVTQLVLTATGLHGREGGAPAHPRRDAVRPVPRHRRDAADHARVAAPPRRAAAEAARRRGARPDGRRARAPAAARRPQLPAGRRGRRRGRGADAVRRRGLPEVGGAEPRRGRRAADPRRARQAPRARRRARRGGGKRVEVLLDRQLALVIDGGRVVRTITVSSGAAGTPTPPGSYSVFRKEQRSWSVPFSVWLPWASYFVGGIAFHEYAGRAALRGLARLRARAALRREVAVRPDAERHARSSCSGARREAPARCSSPSRCWRSPRPLRPGPPTRCRRSCPTR